MLQVEVDGVLLPAVHTVEVRAHGDGGGVTVTCAEAFLPLVGKQFVAWKFTSQPTATLVFATRSREEDPGVPSAADVFAAAGVLACWRGEGKGGASGSAGPAELRSGGGRGGIPAAKRQRLALPPEPVSRATTGAGAQAASSSGDPVEGALAEQPTQGRHKWEREREPASATGNETSACENGGVGEQDTGGCRQADQPQHMRDDQLECADVDMDADGLQPQSPSLAATAAAVEAASRGLELLVPGPRLLCTLPDSGTEMYRADQNSISGGAGVPSWAHQAHPPWTSASQQQAETA